MLELPKALFRNLLLVLCCATLAACSSNSSKPVTGRDDVRDALYQQFSEWRGVPYRLGGVSKKGVDCSALVQITYRDAFSVDLPRSTWDLARVGTPVKPEDRRSGDLVFFKIGLWDNHVGIYLENGRFMHASASQGVMISSLQEPYWQQRYWKTLRPLPAELASR